MCLLGDVADGGPLLADDGPDVLRGHQEPQGDIGVLVLGGHPGAWGAAAAVPAAGAVAGAPAVVGPPRAALRLGGLVGDVGDVQGIVLKLVAIELLDGSEGRTDARSFWIFFFLKRFIQQ